MNGIKYNIKLMIISYYGLYIYIFLLIPIRMDSIDEVFELIQFI